jgi:hypothetical protein
MGEKLSETREHMETQKEYLDDVGKSLCRNLHQLQAEKSLEEHDFTNQIHSLLRRIEQLEIQLAESKDNQEVNLLNCEIILQKIFFRENRLKKIERSKIFKIK